MQCTLNVYGSDAVVRGDSRGVENSPPKSGSLFALHTHRLSFISIDAVMVVLTHRSITNTAVTVPHTVCLLVGSC